MTNWLACQCPIIAGRVPRTALEPHGILPKYLAGGTFHADARKKGKSRKTFKSNGKAGVTNK